MTTSERLALELEKFGCPADMVKRARDGYYDDFRSPLATPCIQLVTELRALKKFALAHRAAEGEFDCTREEADAWMESEGWALLGREKR